MQMIKDWINSWKENRARNKELDGLEREALHEARKGEIDKFVKAKASAETKQRLRPAKEGIKSDSYIEKIGNRSSEISSNIDNMTKGMLDFSIREKKRI